MRASRDIAPLGLRMPTEIRERIEEAARENGRSMNSEILSRLQAADAHGAERSAPERESLRTLPPSRTADQFVVRFPDGMRSALAAEAKVHRRSVNSEIVQRLEMSLGQAAHTFDLSTVSADALLAELRRRLR